MTIAATVLLFLLALGGCATRLVPAPDAQVLPGRGAGAVARGAGVQLSASARAWTGRPLNLETAVTPILVTIENGGPVPLRVRRDDFVLVPPEGAPLQARGPWEIGGVVIDPAPTGLAYPRTSIGVGFGLGTPFFRGDPFFSDDYYYPMQVRVPLPTGDMVQMALPETPLEPGGRTSGFLYFDRPKRRAKRYDFTARLVDARSGEPIGTVIIPFVVE